VTAQLTFGSLFAGIGGIDLGLERAGMRCKWQVEIDDYATKVLAKHWPDVPKYRDVRGVGAHNLARVDVLAGGFPCQDISNAGKRAGITGERSGLWLEFARLICELRPRYVLVENVAALLVRGIDTVLGRLAALRYDAEWHCIPAAAVGAPHVRDRVFIVAYANSGDEYGRRGALQMGRLPFPREIAAARHIGRTQWGTESRVPLLAHGVSSRVEQLNGFGNAVVPQVAEFVGLCIQAHYQSTQ
jgi:DNA (cytosine-5)-methyltransferase 1